MKEPLIKWVLRQPWYQKPILLMMMRTCDGRLIEPNLPWMCHDDKGEWINVTEVDPWVFEETGYVREQEAAVARIAATFFGRMDVDISAMLNKLTGMNRRIASEHVAVLAGKPIPRFRDLEQEDPIQFQRQHDWDHRGDAENRARQERFRNMVMGQPSPTPPGKHVKQYGQDLVDEVLGQPGPLSKAVDQFVTDLASKTQPNRALITAGEVARIHEEAGVWVIQHNRVHTGAPTSTVSGYLFNLALERKSAGDSRNAAVYFAALDLEKSSNELDAHRSNAERDAEVVQWTSDHGSGYRGLDM